jgi:phage-related protein
MATDLGQAYVQIVASAEGISGSITSALSSEADSAGKSAGQSISKNIGNSLGGVGKVLDTIGRTARTVVKATAAGVTAGGVAIGALTKQSIDAFANYEQLAGGIKKLFGDASEAVMQNASEAYKTSGMSANQYMEQVTGFSAALINSLGGNTKEAAKLADVAMQSMSDNVNTFGTDMASVQYAFQGFAKGNYTMLDNLKLGYGGTKTEMERLIADAAKAKDAQEKLGLSVDGTSLSFDNIVKAIQVVQYEQGIAGTTAAESAKTIEGAFNMTKAAWENLVAGFANPDADLGQLMDNLIVAVVGDKEGEGLLNQLIPAVERALQGIGQFVQKAAPIISQYLPGLMNAILPGLLSAATSLVAGLVKALPTLIGIVIRQIPSIIAQLKAAVVESAPMMIEGGKQLMQSLYDGLTQAFPQLTPVLNGLGKVFEVAFNGIGKVIDFFIKHFETIKGVVVVVAGAIAGVGLVGIIAGIAGAISTVVGAIGGLISALSMIKSFAGLVSVITTLAGGPLILIPALIGAIVAAVIYLWNTSETFRNFVLGLWAKIQEIVAGAGTVLKNLAAAFVSIGQDIINTVTNAWNMIVNGVTTAIKTVQSVIDTGFKLVQKIVYSVMAAVFGKIKYIFVSIKTTVSNAVGNVRTAVSNAFSAVRSTVSSAMGAAGSTIANVWNTAKSVVSNALNNIKSAISDKLTAAKNTVSNIFGNIKNAIRDKLNDAKEAVSNTISVIKKKFNFSWSLPKLKLPHIKITGSWSLKPPFSFPHFSISWYKKARQTPYMFQNATLFGAGEAGDEILYGRESLLRDIREAAGGTAGYTQNITINSPKQLNPSEVARQTKLQTRRMVMRMRTT